VRRFNNHAGSTKELRLRAEHNEAVNRLDFWPTREAIGADYADGEVIEVPAGAEGSCRSRSTRSTATYGASGLSSAFLARPGVELGASLGAVFLQLAGVGGDGGELEAGTIGVEEVDRFHPAVVV
jgi:hypothetical protein